MRSPYPKPNLDADVEETRRVFVKYWTEQELYFPHPPDDTWKDHMRALHAECVDRAIVLHGHTAHDYDSWIEFALSLGEAYPDSETTYDAMAVEGDVGVALWTYRGTHLRPLRGHPPTGKSITVRGALASRVANGKIVEQWGLLDRLEWLKQLGAIDASIDL